MSKLLAGALTLAALPSALAFRNTSPFFLFSTADVLLPSASGSVADASTLTSHVLEALKDCPTQSYVLVQREGASSADYLDPRSAPHLSQYMSGKHDAVRTTVAIPEVVGQVDGAAIMAHLQSKCAPKGAEQDAGHWLKHLVSQVPSASTAHKIHEFHSHDTALEQAIADKTTAQDYTVIYVTSPQTESQAKAQLQQEHYAYDMEDSFSRTVQMELKRDLSSSAKQPNSTEGGLFERYQYFTPGIFMGFAAIIPLFLILLVGIRALTSLEVSYFAFSKDMGPSAQKKQ